MTLLPHQRIQGPVGTGGRTRPTRSTSDRHFSGSKHYIENRIPLYQPITRAKPVCLRTVSRQSLWCLIAVLSLNPAFAQPPAADEEPRDPASITLLQMDLDSARNIIRKHDLDDDGSISKTERKRLNWEADDAQRFDLSRDGRLQHVELALKMADARLDNGIVQMDANLSERYLTQYDTDRNGKLSMDELSRNVFTDAQESFDKDADGELTKTELTLGLAFERRLRDELGIKGCDQGGAMRLINVGDQNQDRCLADDELDLAGLKSNAMKFDRNGDGRLSVSELAELLSARRRELGMTPSDQLAARGLMRQFDRDRDGLIPVSEVRLAPNADGQRPKWDLNEDGEITQLELETYYGQQRKELGYDDEDSDRALVLMQRNDADGSRSLSKSELVASGADANSPLSPTKLPLVDEDKNGTIEVQELARYLKKTR